MIFQKLQTPAKIFSIICEIDWSRIFFLFPIERLFKHSSSIRLHSFIRSFVLSFDSPIHGNFMECENPHSERVWWHVWCISTWYSSGKRSVRPNFNISLHSILVKISRRRCLLSESYWHAGRDNGWTHLNLQLKNNWKLVVWNCSEFFYHSLLLLLWTTIDEVPMSEQQLIRLHIIWLERGILFFPSYEWQQKSLLFNC